MGPFSVLGFGELLWDEVAGEQRLGGAPANVAYHATLLGDRGQLASCVGTDARGVRAIDMLRRGGVDTTAVQRNVNRPTGSAHVDVSATGASRFALAMDAAWTTLAWTPLLQQVVQECDAICFGSLIYATAEGREAVEHATRLANGHALRVLDLNLRPPYTPEHAVLAALSGADVIKLTEEELEVLAAQLGRGPQTVDWLLQQRGYRMVVVTRGARGAVIHSAHGGRIEHSGFVVDTVEGDPVGAGDAFTAALVHHLLRGHDEQRALAAANRYAAFVATQHGAMPQVPAALVRTVTLDSNG